MPRRRYRRKTAKASVSHPSAGSEPKNLRVFGRSDGHKCSLHSVPHSAQRTESVIHCRRLITAVHHAIGTARVSRLGAILVPFGSLQKFCEGIRVPILQQVTRFLPAEHVEGGHSPGSTGII